MMIKRNYYILCIGLLLLGSHAVNAAYCSLRDPVAAITSLYADSNQYRSIITEITEEHRNNVRSILPFTLHRSEVGKHTLYLALNNNTPLGFIQARTELTDWGLIEIAWSINFDMTVKGLFFQRCRNPGCDENLSQKITQLLKGKSFDQIKAMLTKDGKDLAIHVSPDLADSRDILYLSIKSALKTIAITEISWRLDTILFNESAEQKK